MFPSFKQLTLMPILILASSLLSTAFAGAPSFEQAKQLLKKHVYFDQNQGQGGDFYCGCDWNWVGRSGGRIDLQSCGYQVRAQPERAQRTEFEHIFAASALGKHRLCWQNGGRDNCAANDPIFQEAYVDLFNLRVVVGEPNADRSDYRFAVIPGQPHQYGSCSFEVDFKSRIAEPADSVKGEIARVNFYMSDRYQIRMSEQQQKLFLAWHKQFPVSPRERLLHDRTAAIMGHQNPYVTGTNTWQLGNGVQDNVTANRNALPPTPPSTNAPIKANVKSKVYHLSNCPSYNKVSDKNVREFYSEQLAIDAGFRRAGNCK